MKKEPYMHNVTAFKALELGSYAVDKELQRFVGKRAADFFEYAVSAENDCLVCSTYFRKLLRDQNIDFETFQFTPQEELLVEYGRAIANDSHNIPETLMDQLQNEFDEEQLVVLTTMGVMMVANNYFNNILDVDVDAYLMTIPN